MIKNDAVADVEDDKKNVFPLVVWNVFGYLFIYFLIFEKAEEWRKKKFNYYLFNSKNIII